MHQTTYLKNLALPETTIGFDLNILFKHHNLLFVPEPEDYSTSCNTTLLKKYDECDETRGKVSFIPLDFLTIVLKDHVSEDDKKFKTLLDKKIYYLKLFKKMFKIDKSFFKKVTYKDVPLCYFRKPYLNSELTKTVDQCRLINSNNEEQNILNNKINLNLVNPCTDIIRNKNEWLSKYDIEDVVKCFYFSLDRKKRDDIIFKGVMYINSQTYLTRQFFYSVIKNSFNWEIKKNTRFIFFFILYRSHFTAVFIDLNVITKNNHKTRFAYFFNSCGYNPNEFNLDKDYWFIDSSMSFMRHKNCFIKYSCNNYVNTPFESLTDILRKEYGVTNFVFNNFCIQHLDSECGIFSTMFFLTCLNMIDKKEFDNINVGVFRYIYFNMLSLGSDHIYSCFRGLFFFTNEDAKEASLNKEEYLKSLDIYKIQNSKFKNYLKIYNKSLQSISSIGRKYKIEIL